MSRKFDDFLQEQLRDPEIRKEYEALQPEHMVAQGDISKLERRSANPSIRTLKRLAKGMGMVLKIEFTPERVSVGK